MKIFYILSLVVLFFSCTTKKTDDDKKEDQRRERKIVVPEFQMIIDTANINGAILFYNLQNNTYYSNDFEWSLKGNLPASTFKITNSIIALETGVVENDSTLLKWNGEKRRLKNWEQNLTFQNAFHFSCVPCYQEVARKVGAQQMNEYLDKLEYGNMIVDTTNIDLFWLTGTSHISQFQQINFLKRLYQSKLPISKRTEAIMKRMMLIEDNADYKLSGKTGWSIEDGNNNGWFVGYIEDQNETYFFATNVEPNQHFDMLKFPMIRKDLTLKAFEKIKSQKKTPTRK